ncbi:MAG TPA: hypothetical protein VGN72_10230 [Tepidisphaeraceae bacterium]|jgi:hypothetical protein|nr:hypothetical protein [Tepidisphaeraceae bacterium]
MTRTTVLSTLSLLAIVTTGCTAGRDVKQTAGAKPAGRGSSVAMAPLGRTATQPSGGAHSGTVAHADSGAATAMATALAGQTVSLHLIQGAPALAPGPRRDVLKGVLRSIDSQWIILETEGGKRLFVPRTSVLAIEQE